MRWNFMLSLALLLPVAGCALGHHPETLAPAPMPEQSDWQDLKAGPGVVEVESLVSARWQAKLGGLLNLKDEKAVAAGFENEPYDIVLPLHLLKHPKHGLFIIDSGISESIARGEGGDMGGLVAKVLSNIEPVKSLGQVVEEAGEPVAGVFITHMHMDHVLGLEDLPDDTPIYAGPGELGARKGAHILIRRTYRRIFEGRMPLRTWDFEAGQPLASIDSAIDIFGDGSIWALSTQGHTPGSTSYLVHSTTGPKLFVGDTSHTYWGFENGVEPGTFTSDHEENRRSLMALKALVDELPGLEVYMGHEMKVFRGE